MLSIAKIIDTLMIKDAGLVSNAWGPKFTAAYDPNMSAEHTVIQDHPVSTYTLTAYVDVIIDARRDNRFYAAGKLHNLLYGEIIQRLTGILNDVDHIPKDKTVNMLKNLLRDMTVS